MDQLLNYVRGFSFGGTTYEKGGEFGPIMRPYFALLTVEQGECTLRTENLEVRVKAGQTGIAAANERFEFLYRRGQPTTAYWCEGLMPKLNPADFSHMVEKYDPISTSPRFWKLQEIGFELGHDSGPELNTMRDALGQAVCRAFLFDARKSKVDQITPRAVQVARRFIKEHLDDEELNLASIAAQSGVTPQHLITVFKKHFGTTPSRYLWQLRASSARKLLIHSQLSQSQIAFKCGFKSQPHFSRTIRKMFGMTPAELRKDMGYTPPSDTEGTVSDTQF